MFRSWIPLTLLAASAVASASTIIVSASCPLAPVTVTTANSATCGPTDGDFASGSAGLSNASAYTERTQFEGLFIGPQASGDFIGSFNLIILGGSGSGLYTPDLLLTLFGDIESSAVAYAKWNDRYVYKDSAGNVPAQSYCPAAFVSLCGTPFTFGVQIPVTLELFASASAGGRFNQQITSAKSQLKGIATSVDGVTSQETSYLLIEIPEPNTMILLILGGAVLSFGRAVASRKSVTAA